MHTITFVAYDAEDQSERLVTIRTDRHGLTVEVAGTEESVILDLNKGSLNVWLANEDGECCERQPRLSLDLNRTVDLSADWNENDAGTMLRKGE